MLHMRYAQPGDEAFWLRLDRHLTKEGFAQKVRDKAAYLLLKDKAPAALLRYNLFWDSIPFCNLLMVVEESRGRGCGRALMSGWEKEMSASGHRLVLTSTRADESAQHFYRKLGYQDAGALFLRAPGYAQPAELFFAKELHP